MLVRRTCAGLILIRQDHYRRCATFVDRRLWLVAIGFASGQPSGAEACATRRRSYIGPLHLSRSSLRSLTLTSNGCHCDHIVGVRPHRWTPRHRDL